MKRVGGLFEQIADARSLVLAACRAARGKRERPEVRRFLAAVDRECASLARTLAEGSFEFGRYRTFIVHDPKRRVIHAPEFRDRVVHHAIIAAAGPVFERGAIPRSYACRAGFGQHAALRQARAWLYPGAWFLKLDIRRFYDSIGHQLLLELLERRFRERRFLALWERLIRSYAISPGQGLPIGALTSQYLGNFYLDPFDHWVLQKRRCHRYLRYMDDLVFLGARELLASLADEAARVLEGLGLRSKPPVLNRAAAGLPFLGFVLYPDRTRLNRRGRKRLRGKLRALERAAHRGALDEGELQERSLSLFAHARFGDDLAWRQMVAGFSRFGEAQEPGSPAAGRFVKQLREELPLGLSQQEQAG